MITITESKDVHDKPSRPDVEFTRLKVKREYISDHKQTLLKSASSLKELLLENE